LRGKEKGLLGAEGSEDDVVVEVEVAST